MVASIGFGFFVFVAFWAAAKFAKPVSVLSLAKILDKKSFYLAAAAKKFLKGV
ncbi:MAG: hypothetical protein ISS45_09955 [Candidatus Omnitrophica bacterium]|nr:hypothetical protein [Candidatus Omnitrophota bacterium]